MLGIGVGFAAVGRKPIEAIVAAQALNGLFLPAVALFLLVALNRGALLGRYRNGPAANLLGIVIVALTLAVGIAQLLRTLG